MRRTVSLPAVSCLTDQLDESIAALELRAPAAAGSRVPDSRVDAGQAVHACDKVDRVEQCMAGGDQAEELLLRAVGVDLLQQLGLH